MSLDGGSPHRRNLRRYQQWNVSWVWEHFPTLAPSAQSQCNGQRNSQELPLGSGLGLQMVVNHEQSGKWHKTHDTVHIETFHNCLKNQSPIFSLSTLPASPLHHHKLIPLSQSSLTALNSSQIHSLQFRCFPQRRKRFKAQDKQMHS